MRLPSPESSDLQLFVKCYSQQSFRLHRQTCFILVGSFAAGLNNIQFLTATAVNSITIHTERLMWHKVALIL